MLEQLIVQPNCSRSGYHDHHHLVGGGGGGGAALPQVLPAGSAAPITEGRYIDRQQVSSSGFRSLSGEECTMMMSIRAYQGEEIHLKS